MWSFGAMQIRRDSKETDFVWGRGENQGAAIPCPLADVPVLYEKIKYTIGSLSPEERDIRRH